jgi:hypothetical protein
VAVATLTACLVSSFVICGLKWRERQADKKETQTFNFNAL